MCIAAFYPVTDTLFPLFPLGADMLKFHCYAHFAPRGIGRAIADTLAGEGAGVAICARNTEQVTNAVTELQTLGARAVGATVDITDGAALKTWIANVAREFGGINMLFSNAGAMAQGGDPASWEQNFRLDVLGAVNAFEAVRPFLEASGEQNGDAAFVIISSIAAAQADTNSSYGPVKAALIHMAKGLARQIYVISTFA
jgi:3-oxoacyl-[acyl-carrier protein] reductase